MCLIIAVFILFSVLMIKKIHTATQDKTLMEAVGSIVKKAEQEFQKGYKDGVYTMPPDSVEKYTIKTKPGDFDSTGLSIPMYRK